jgi:DNA-binding FadR family transcriptional regulator
MTSPIKSKTTVDIVCSYLRKRILNGTYKPQTLLPAERKLAETLGVNRLTLRTAISRLQAEHLLESQHGRGVVVKDFVLHATLDIVADLSEDTIVGEMFELRKNLLVEVVCLATKHITTAQLKELEAHIYQQNQEKSIKAFFDGDIFFVQLLLQASHSLPLQLIFNSFHRVFRAHEERSYEILQDKERVLHNYKLIFSLIRNRDDDLSRRTFFGFLTQQEQERVRELYFSDWQ